MAKIPMDRLKPGMVLSSDVTDISGRLILGGGATLTEKHLQIFKIWGIYEADIEGDEPIEEEEGTAADDPVILERSRDYCDAKFRFAGREHPFLRELYNVCVKRRARSDAR